MFEEEAQSYRVKDKEIYRVKLACQNTKVYRVNTQLTKGTITLLYFFCFFLHMRTLSVLDKYRVNVLGPCRARAITLFTVFPWRVTYAWLNIVITMSSFGSMAGAVVRALAFHQCALGLIPGFDSIHTCRLSLLVLYSALRGFSPGTPVFPSPQKSTFDLFFSDFS